MQTVSFFIGIMLVGIAVYKYGTQILRHLQNRSRIESSLELLRENLGKPFPEYKMSEEMYQRFCEGFHEDSVLTEAAVDILNHCNIESPKVRVHAIEELSPQVAGNYHSVGGTGIINIKIDRYTRPEIALAVLIHECMHFFLHQRRISFPETYDNEVLTDTAMIYAGFFSYIDRGYINVGYISYGAIKRIRSEISLTEPPL